MTRVATDSGERTLAGCWSRYSAATNFESVRLLLAFAMQGKVRKGRMALPARYKRALPDLIRFLARP